MDIFQAGSHSSFGSANAVGESGKERGKKREIEFHFELVGMTDNFVSLACSPNHTMQLLADCETTGSS